MKQEDIKVYATYRGKNGEERTVVVKTERLNKKGAYEKAIWYSVNGKYGGEISAAAFARWANEEVI